MTKKHEKLPNRQRVIQTFTVTRTPLLECDSFIRIVYWKTCWNNKWLNEQNHSSSTILVGISVMKAVQHKLLFMAYE